MAIALAECSATTNGQQVARMQRTVPILHIDSYEEAKAYYVDWLGFNIDWEFRFEPTFPVYMQVSRDGLVLHLSEHKGEIPVPQCATSMSMTWTL
jgi:hypothetical protein